MGLPISFVICGAIAGLTIYLGIVQTLQVRRLERSSLDEVLRREQEITEGLQKLCELEGAERLVVCRSLANAMGLDASYLLQMVWGPFLDQAEEKAEIRELRLAAIREARAVVRMVKRTSFLMSFRPSLVKDCHRMVETAQQHCRMWIAFLRLWRAEYPDQFGDLAVPELADL
jgi:hypothetical protein